MNTAKDNNLETIKRELAFIARAIQDGVNFETVDEIAKAVCTARAALEAHELDLIPETADVDVMAEIGEIKRVVTCHFCRPRVVEKVRGFTI